MEFRHPYYRRAQYDESNLELVVNHELTALPRITGDFQIIVVNGGTKVRIAETIEAMARLDAVGPDVDGEIDFEWRLHERESNEAAPAGSLPLPCRSRSRIGR